MRRKKVIHSFSPRCWAEVCTGFTSHCLCSRCTFTAVGLAICEVYIKLERVYMTLFFFTWLPGACTCHSSGVCMCTFHVMALVSGVRIMSSRRGGLVLFVCAVRPHKDGNDTSQSRGSSEN